MHTYSLFPIGVYENISWIVQKFPNFQDQMKQYLESWLQDNAALNQVIL